MRDMPVSRKLATIIAAATTAAVLLMSAAFIGYDYSLSRREALEQLEMLGKMVAGNSTAAVAFGDPRTAAEVLNTLKEQPDIEAGCTYDAERKVLAEYHRTPKTRCPEQLPSSTVTFADGGAAYTQVIQVIDTVAGTIYVDAGYNIVGM